MTAAFRGGGSYSGRSFVLRENTHCGHRIYNPRGAAKRSRAALAISDVERAGGGGGADAARGRQQDGLLRREPPSRQAQALPGAGQTRWQEREPGQLRHSRGGGTVCRAVAGGAGGGAEGCSALQRCGSVRVRVRVRVRRSAPQRCGTDAVRDARTKENEFECRRVCSNSRHSMW